MDELEELEEAIKVEMATWGKLGLNPNGLRHDPASMWALKLQVQSMMNVLLKKELVTEDELNLEYKRLTLNDMRAIRENFEKARREALVPDMKIVDGFGREFKP